MTPKRYLKVSGQTQEVSLIDADKIIFSAAVSTALKGFGEVEGSEMTPRGWHDIYQKIGADAPVNTVFVGRKPTGEIYSSVLANAEPERDWILTRILWLQGLTKANANSKKRYIYFHGTPERNPMNVPLSHGCIRMHNEDILKLFELVDEGTPVLIEE